MDEGPARNPGPGLRAARDRAAALNEDPPRSPDDGFVAGYQDMLGVPRSKITPQHSSIAKESTSSDGEEVRPTKKTAVQTPSILGAIHAYMAEGHLFPGEAVRIERSGTQAWVVDRYDYGIQLFPSEAHARRAIEKALRAYKRKSLDVPGSVTHAALPNIIDVLRRAPYRARVTFSDRSKRFGPSMHGRSAAMDGLCPGSPGSRRVRRRADQGSSSSRSP